MIVCSIPKIGVFVVHLSFPIWYFNSLSLREDFLTMKYLLKRRLLKEAILSVRREQTISTQRLMMESDSDDLKRELGFEW